MVLLIKRETLDRSISSSELLNKQELVAGNKWLTTTTISIRWQTRQTKLNDISLP